MEYSTPLLGSILQKVTSLITSGIFSVFEIIALFPIKKLRGYRMKIKKFTKNRKAELTTKQLVMIIILITSFIIILFLLFRLNLGETTAKEICHNSVVLKGKAGAFAGALDCRTNYLCISGGKDCEEIPTTSTTEITLNKKETLNETMKAIADEMADCWWMFGEGKINYVGDKFFGNVACALCSVIDFDETIEGSVSYSEFFNYLKTTPKSSSQTYLQYLYEGNMLKEGDPYYQNELDFNKQYVLITGMVKKGFFNRVIEWPHKQIKSLFTDEEEIKAGVFTVLFGEKENINIYNCDEFITKA